MYGELVGIGTGDLNLLYLAIWYHELIVITTTATATITIIQWLMLMLLMLMGVSNGENTVNRVMYNLVDQQLVSQQVEHTFLGLLEKRMLNHQKLVLDVERGKGEEDVALIVQFQGLLFQQLFLLLFDT